MTRAHWLSIPSAASPLCPLPPLSFSAASVPHSLPPPPPALSLSPSSPSLSPGRRSAGLLLLCALRGHTATAPRRKRRKPRTERGASLSQSGGEARSEPAAAAGGGFERADSARIKNPGAEAAAAAEGGDASHRALPPSITVSAAQGKRRGAEHEEEESRWGISERRTTNGAVCEASPPPLPDQGRYTFSSSATR